MEMVAASKMRKAQERMRAAPTPRRFGNIAGRTEANPEYRHPFLVKKPGAGGAGIIVVTTDKGLAGGLNTNLLRAVTSQAQGGRSAGQKAEVVAIGGQGPGFSWNRAGAKVCPGHQLGDQPHIEALIGPVKVLLDAYAKGEPAAVTSGYTSSSTR